MKKMEKDLLGESGGDFLRKDSWKIDESLEEKLNFLWRIQVFLENFMSLGDYRVFWINGKISWINVKMS